MSLRSTLFAAASLTAVVILAAPQAGAATFAAQSVEIRSAAARLIVIPENRTDIDVQTKPGSSLAAPAVRLDGGRVLIDGQLGGRIRGCRGGAERFTAVTIDGQGLVPVSALPEITIRVPLTVKLSAGGALATRVGPSNGGAMAFQGCGAAQAAAVTGSLDLSLDGSGDVDVADVKGGVTVALDGSGDIRMGAVGPAKLVLTGSGDLNVARVAGPLDARVKGSGDLKIESATGSTGTLSVAGSGDLTIDAGRIDTLAVSLAGSGDIRFAGRAGLVSAALNGSGDISVAGADKIGARSKAGSGEIEIGS